MPSTGELGGCLCARMRAAEAAAAGWCALQLNRGDPNTVNVLEALPAVIGAS